MRLSYSRSEGFSKVIAEAMSCGIPCVVADVGLGLNCWRNWHYCPPSSPKDLAMALKNISSQGLSAINISAGRRIIDHFSLKRLIDNTEDILIKCIQ